MKKNLLILAFAAPLIAFGQIVQKSAFYMGDGVKVRVQKETTVYTDGKFKVAAGATTVGSTKNKFSNHGNVKVNGAFITNDKASTTVDESTRFVNVFNSGTDYGQLIITNGTNVEGKITSEYKFATADKFSYFNMAFPFKGKGGTLIYTPADAVAQSGITAPLWKPKAASRTRYQAPLFVRNNKTGNDDIVDDNVLQSDEMIPYNAYSVNQYSYPTIAGQKHRFIGVPNNEANYIDYPEYNLNGKKNSDFNIYQEYYGSYIIDVTRKKPDNWTNYENVGNVDAGDYGKNIYMFGNPYTSNINLEPLIADLKVDAIILEQESKYWKKEGSTANSVPMKKVGFFNGGTSSNPDLQLADIGDQYKVVRPHQIVTVRTKDGHGLNFTFSDDYKTFKVENNGAVALTSRKKRTSGVYQVGLDLYRQGEETDNRFYVVAADFYQPKGQSNYEAYNDWLSDNEIGFYSLQENQDGTIVDEMSNQKVYINGVNSIDYVAKPIHVVFQGKDETAYTLKARLNEDLLSSGNTFYFEDKKEGKIMEITPDFEYTFVEPEVAKDRFVIYWNGLPQTMATQDVTSSQTRVYRDGQDHKVRFAVEFNRADVYVYDLSGRLLSAEKSVDTSVDHTLPYLSKDKVFVVKVIGDNGVVTTQKIIK